MNPVNPLFAVSALLTALMTAWLLLRRLTAPQETGRYVAIDGLRGYLAFFVFLHHSAVWYFYLRTGQWASPPSHLFTHFGRGSVALFFMITGFLFFSKLIDGRARPISWPRLYVSRVLRLAPLYLFAMLVLATVVAALSNFTLREAPYLLVKQTVRWMSFTILGTPNLNGIDQTQLILAGVTWSLPYEWFFYFSLPVLALFVRVFPPTIYILAGVAAVAAFVLWRPELIHLGAFGGGISAAVMAREAPVRRQLAGWAGSIVALVSLTAAVFIFASPAAWAALLLLATTFTIIACGNTLFGILRTPVSCMLGEMAYSIYLLHGALLYVTFKLVIGLERAATFTTVEHWAVICGCSVLLILMCALTFRLIEAPAMRLVPAVSGWLEGRPLGVTKERLVTGESVGGRIR